LNGDGRDKGGSAGFGVVQPGGLVPVSSITRGSGANIGSDGISAEQVLHVLSTNRAVRGALGRLRRRTALAALALFALLFQAFLPPLHEAQDIAEAFARAADGAHSPAELVQAALALLDRHEHGAPVIDADHAPGDPHHGAPGNPGGDDHGLPCPVLQAAAGAANFVAPTPPVLALPVFVSFAPTVVRDASLLTDPSFSRPRSRAPPPSV